MTLAAGTLLGPYEILAPLGAGGMGEVWRARDTRLNREVAVKVLPADFAKDADRLRRFEQEARATSALNHPNILTVYDIATHEEAPYIVAELLEGEELRDQLNDGAMAPRKAIDYAQQIAAGLAAARGKGVTHRDLKPENIFITTDGRVKILDFGLAKLRPQGSAVSSGSDVQTQKAITDAGTVGYMSPEQVRGQEADHRSDIFSFGVIFYEMLSGKRTFTGDSAIFLQDRVHHFNPAPARETCSQRPPRPSRWCLTGSVPRRHRTVVVVINCLLEMLPDHSMRSHVFRRHFFKSAVQLRITVGAVAFDSPMSVPNEEPPPAAPGRKTIEMDQSFICSLESGPGIRNERLFSGSVDRVSDRYSVG